MKITKEWLEENNACQDGVDWLERQKDKNEIEVIKKLREENKYGWANWLLVRLMKYEQYVAYAIYAAELVLPLYEKKPDDSRPKKAIEAAKECLKSPTKTNRKKAYAAADAAYVAADEAKAAAYAAQAAAAYSAYAAGEAAGYADAKKQTQVKVLNYGLSLLDAKK